MEVPVETFELLTCASAACGVALAIGWREGYHSVAAYVVFWLFLTLVGLTSIGIERRAFRSRGVADHVLRVGIIAFALIVLSGLLLGSAGLLGRVSYLALFGLCALWTLSWRTVNPPDARRGGIHLPPAVVALVSPVVMFIVAVGLTHLPGRYDSLNYHLYFPARWLQDHQLSIIPTPFGDEAPAYAPSNGELWFLWLMLPFHGDLVARIGQVPFYLLIGIAQYLLARRMGAKPAQAMWIPAFFLLARPIVEEAVGADVDLIFTAMFVTSLYLGITAVDTNRRSDWILWGVSLGLCWGTKYLALVYVPVFLLLALMRGPRLGSLWASAGVAALALPWYVRNWIVAGSPIYPSSLKIAGLTIARGAFDRSAMLNSIFHLTDFRLFGVVAGHGFGTPLLLFWIPLWLVGAAALLARGPWWPTRFLVLLPVAAVPLDWFGAPDNSDWRFIFPIIAVALLPLAFTFREKQGVNRGIHLLYAAGLIWLVLGLDRTITVQLATLPYYMRDWLSLRGLVPVHYLPLFTILAGAAVYCWRAADRARHGLVLAFCLFSTACALVGAASQAVCPPGGCELLNLTSAYIRQTMFDGWSWVREHTHDATIAYTGNNIPYPLYGDRLTNRVYYVNIDRHLEWRLHDYDRAEKRRRDDMRAPDTARLALSSGVLAPIAAGVAANGGAVRPRFERMDGYRDAWLANLKALRVTHLFVTALSAYEIDYIWHQPQGFPIEEEWAAADSAAFVLVYENPQVKIYAVSLK